MNYWLIYAVILSYVFYESVVISLYRLFQKSNPDFCTWIILGLKGVKLLLTVMGILLVRELTQTPIKKFALITIAIYVVSIVVETIFFLKKKQNDQ